MPTPRPMPLEEMETFDDEGILELGERLIDEMEVACATLQVEREDDAANNTA